MLTRLSRLILRPRFVDDLRMAATPADTLAIITETERQLTTRSTTP